MLDKKEIFWYLSGIVIVCFYFFPFLILGEESKIFIHDNLEISFIQRVILVRNGIPFSPSFPMEQVMNGLPRAYYPSSLSIINVFFFMFPPFVAYMVNEFFVRIIAYTGMYLLLKNYLMEDSNWNRYLIILGSILFAFIQFYSIQGLTVAGQPLLVYAFLNLLYGRNKKLSYTLICLFSLYSFFVYSTLFILVFLLIFGLVYVFKTKTIPTDYIKGFLLLFGFSLLVEYNLVIQVLDSFYISNRTDFVVPILSLNEIRDQVYNKYTTPYHSGTFDPILVITAFCLYIIIHRKIPLKIQIGVASIAMVFAMIFGAIYLKQITVSWGLELAKAFDATRFSFLLPFLWTTLFIVSLSGIISNKFLRLIVPVLFFFHIKGVLKGDPKTNTYLPNWENVLKINDKKEDKADLNYASFFATDLFKEIGEFIAKDKSTYRVVSVGMSPSIAQYNGFYTLDSYENSYSLEYKRDFRKIIGNEIQKNPVIERYYDTWGCRCYVLPVELNRNYFFDKNSKKVIKNLDIDIGQFSKMNGEYIFSAVEILNAEKKHLKLEKIFTNKTSFWKVFLYKA
ncbi:DUF6044 family protein [Arenibacter sp. F26102]|uniref:DUF6044 family protein n=1 Tax=Arenibacter sp. F26102 TaxID=2926416 RepID=UPI001FF1341A|nr:DUF6044 family protein [Arenibacter sp. F26102]MCK0144105.1 DUF6044 family protein [Arenibacter sp. F26102]